METNIVVLLSVSSCHGTVHVGALGEDRLQYPFPEKVVFILGQNCTAEVTGANPISR